MNATTTTPAPQTTKTSDTPKPPETPPPEVKSTKASVSRESSDPGPFHEILTSHTGGKLHIQIPGISWGNDLDLSNAAYAAAITTAIRRVNDDFNSRRPKTKVD